MNFLFSLLLIACTVSYGPRAVGEPKIPADLGSWHKSYAVSNKARVAQVQPDGCGGIHASIVVVQPGPCMHPQRHLPSPCLCAGTCKPAGQPVVGQVHPAACAWGGRPGPPASTAEEAECRAAHHSGCSWQQCNLGLWGLLGLARTGRRSNAHGEPGVPDGKKVWSCGKHTPSCNGQLRARRSRWAAVYLAVLIGVQLRSLPLVLLRFHAHACDCSPTR